MKDFRNFEILLILLLKLAELPLVANCWTPTKSGLLLLSQGCSHCEIVADLWSAPSFAFLTKSQGSNREFLHELLSPCDLSPPALNHLSYYCDRQRTPGRDLGRLVNDTQWVPGFLSCCSWMFPEQLRNKFELVSSEKKSSNLDKAPKMWNSARLNSWESFLVTFLSISSDIWVMYNFSHPRIKCVLWLIVACIF